MEIFRPHASSHPATTQLAAQAKTPTAAKAAAARDNGTPGTAGATNITANDFLSLLVAEMKNQDPTANSDPNEYINQLVQVNSLQELIQINQDLGGGTKGNAARAVSPLESRLNAGGGGAVAIPARTPPDPASRLATALSHPGSRDPSAPGIRHPSVAPSIHP